MGALVDYHAIKMCVTALNYEDSDTRRIVMIRIPLHLKAYKSIIIESCYKVMSTPGCLIVCKCYTLKGFKSILVNTSQWIYIVINNIRSCCGLEKSSSSSLLLIEMDYVIHEIM